MKNKKWSVPFISKHQECVYSLSDLQQDSNFLNSEMLYLEIGTGKGDFILNMAKQNPHINFLGVEKSITCLAITTKKIVDAEIKNVRLVAADIIQLFDILPHSRFDGVFLNFSDPWPKKKHAKRRLTYGTFLEHYKRILRPNGELIMKTDNLDLFEYSLISVKEHNFRFTYMTYDYPGDVEFDAQTEYETFFRKEGIKINRLVAKTEETQ